MHSKFAYDKLGVSLREKEGLLTRNPCFAYDKLKPRIWAYVYAETCIIIAKNEDDFETIKYLSFIGKPNIILLKCPSIKDLSFSDT